MAIVNEMLKYVNERAVKMLRIKKKNVGQKKTSSKVIS